MPAEQQISNDELIDQIIFLHEQQGILIEKLKQEKKEVIKPDVQKILDRRAKTRLKQNS